MVMLDPHNMDDFQREIRSVATFVVRALGCAKESSQP